ncbi:MAG TPA: putative selenate ABC transporter substrate-binding protein [Candidatus Caenarcaniphilales bacterium]
MKKVLLSGFLLLLLLPVTACTSAPNTSFTAGPGKDKPFTMGAIPDQDPEKIQRLSSKLAKYLEAELKVPVVYKPVTDYTAAVTAFKVGDLDIVWFGGLTGVQARLQVPGASAIAQRDIDAQFHSVFIANNKSGLTSIKAVQDLTQLKGHSFTFGSESSTSGRLMPQYFLEQAGVQLQDFKGQAGFSKSHDATIALVQAGTYDAGVLNEQVWLSRTKAGEVDQNKVQVIWRSPSYYDYHWVINSSIKERYGDDFPRRVQAALTKLDPKVPQQKEILDLFGAAKFIPTQNANYAQVEQIGRKLGKIK